MASLPDPAGVCGAGRGFQGLHRDVEGPQSEERANAVIAEAKRDIPNKPIKYVVNTHNHFDHSGGLRTFVAEGATIITYEGNKAYYEKIFACRTRSIPTGSRKPRRRSPSRR